MPRITSLQKAQDELAGLGLLLSLDRTRLFVLNPEAVIDLSKVKPSRFYDQADRTVGMVLLFDTDGKFAGANYSTMHWNDAAWNDTAGYEVRTDTGIWHADETTLKAAVSYLQDCSPVGSAEKAAEAQVVKEAEEKAEEERVLNLAALNQAVVDNRDGRHWAGNIAEAAAYQRRRLVSDLRDLAKKATEAADKAEQGVRPRSLWFHASDALTIAEHMAHLEALEATLEGPLGDAIKAVAERYGY